MPEERICLYSSMHTLTYYSFFLCLNIYDSSDKELSEYCNAERCLGSGSVGSVRFGFLDPDPFKYADPRIRIQGGQNITLKPQIWTIKKREIIKISGFLNGSSSFSIKISEKYKKKVWKFWFVKKNRWTLWK